MVSSATPSPSSPYSIVKVPVYQVPDLLPGAFPGFVVVLVPSSSFAEMVTVPVGWERVWVEFNVRFAG